MITDNHTAPPVAEKILYFVLQENETEALLGDTEEVYFSVLEEKGMIVARLWYWSQVIRFFPLFIHDLVYGSIMMLKNYLKVAFRNLRRNKLYSLVNVSGLVIGLVCFILAAGYADFELSFDTFHQNADRIYGVVQTYSSANQDKQHSAIIPAPFIPAMLDEFPEIEDAVRFFSFGRMIIRYQDESFYENRVLFADKNFFSFFTFEMINGNPVTALSEPNSIVLSESSALKYFGSENPIGKDLTLSNKTTVRVTGVTKDVPLNSSFKYDFLVSMETVRSLTDWMDDWTVNKHAGFLLLPEGFDPIRLEAKFPSFIDKYILDSPDSPERLYLFPLVDFRIKSENIDSYMAWAHPVGFIFMVGLALTLLIIVCVNFMNLSTARYANRAKEIGIRKVVGAHRRQLAIQFLGESVLMSLIALPIAIIIIEILRPSFNTFIGQDVVLPIWNYPILLLLILGATVLLGIISGSYPAFFLSAFKPVKVIKGELPTGSKGSGTRKTLVILQFALTSVFIVFDAVMMNQLDHLLNVDMGYNRENVYIVPVTEKARPNLELLKDALIRHPDIISVSASTGLPTFWMTERQVIPEEANEDETWTMNTYGIDYDFIELTEIEMETGRSFSRDYADAGNFVINETAGRQLKWEEPIGRHLTMGNLKGTVIGVAKDFHFKDPHFKILPTVLYLEPEKVNYMLVRFSSQDRISVVNEYMKEQWNVIIPDLPFEAALLEHRFEDIYSGFRNGLAITGAAGIMAVFISCLGLFGLATYTVERRTKEIGIRKALGATAPEIAKMFVAQFTKLVIISNIIACPLAYFGAKNFLEVGWVYRTNIGADIFIFAVALTLFVAVISVTFHTIKAALTNPAVTLKYE